MKPITWQTLNDLRLQAERSQDPEAMRRVAGLFERFGCSAGADALRRRAAAYERWEMMEDPYIAEVVL